MCCSRISLAVSHSWTTTLRKTLECLKGVCWHKYWNGTNHFHAWWCEISMTCSYHRGQDVSDVQPKPDVILMADVIYYKSVCPFWTSWHNRRCCFQFWICFTVFGGFGEDCDWTFNKWNSNNSVLRAENYWRQTNSGGRIFQGRKYWVCVIIHVPNWLRTLTISRTRSLVDVQEYVLQ